MRILPRLPGLARLAPAAVLLLLACGSGGDPDEGEVRGGGPASASRPPNLILVVIDTLRADALGSYGAERDTSPHLDDLAARSVRFERAYATAPWTQPSVASILTGLPPSRHGLVDLLQGLPDASLSVVEVLRRHGYATAGVVSSHLLGRRYGFHQGFEVLDESQTPDAPERISTAGVTAVAVRHLDRMAAGGRPFFLFVHYFDPHYTYRDDPAVDFADRRVVIESLEDWQALVARAASLSPPEVATLRALYDEEVRRTDAGIGRLLATLRARQLLEESVVAVTGDHGEEFMEHGRLGHGFALHEELVRVPLLLHLPRGPAGRMVRAPVSNASLATTLLELAGIDPDALPAGAPSLLPALADHSAPLGPVFFEVGYGPEGPASKFDLPNRKAVVDPPWKLVRLEDVEGLRLFDVERDPEETVDLAERRPAVARRLARLLDLHVGDGSGSAPSRPPAEPSDRLRELLESLGYVERQAGDENAPGVESEGRPAR